MGLVSGVQFAYHRAIYPFSSNRAFFEETERTGHPPNLVAKDMEVGRGYISGEKWENFSKIARRIYSKAVQNLAKIAEKKI